PRVGRQVEGGPVDGQHQAVPGPAALEVDVGPHALLGRHVDVRPEVGVGPDLDHRHVEGPVGGADVLEAVEVAGVAAVVDAVPLPGDDPGRPEGVLGVAQAPAAEVPGGRGGEGETADLGGLV